MRVLSVIVTLVLVGPATSFASSARVGRDGALRYTAAPGEENDLLTSGSKPVTLRDSGAVIHPGRGCRSQTRHVVSCVLGPRGRAVAELGDRDDFAFAYRGSFSSVRWHVFGGSGNDSIGPLSRDTVLDCGSGDDLPVLVDASQGEPFLSADCADMVEAAYVDLLGFHAHGGRVTASVRDTVNSDPDVPYACRSGISLRGPDLRDRPGPLLGHAGFALRADHRLGTLSIPLTRQGRVAAHRHATAVVRVLYPSTEGATGCLGVPLPSEVGAVYRIRL